MKIRWLLILVIAMMAMKTDGTFAKERKTLLKEKNINKGFEWIIQGVKILGQVDNFISDRTKSIIRKLHTVYNEDGDTHRNMGKSLKRRY